MSSFSLYSKWMQLCYTVHVACTIMYKPDVIILISAYGLTNPGWCVCVCVDGGWRTLGNCLFKFYKHMTVRIICIYGLHMMYLWKLLLSTTLPCFHFDTASGMQVSSRSVQVIMICYSENCQCSFNCGRMCCSCWALLHVIHVLHTMHVPQMMAHTAVNLLGLATVRFSQLKLTPLGKKELWWLAGYQSP